MSDIETAFNAIKNKQPKFTEYINYYNGDHPLVFSSKRLKTIFPNSELKFSENWCSVVIDSVLDRIELQNLSGKSDTETKTLNDLWMQGQMNDEADRLHESMLVTGEGYLIVWPDEENKAQAFHNDPRKCYMQMDAENPKIPSWGAKIWITDANAWRLNLYYSDRIEKYATNKRSDKAYPDSYKEFKEREDIPSIENTYGLIPMFKFGKKSELKNIIPLQAAVNKLFSDMMVSSEFGSFKQRYILTEAETSTLKNAANEIWTIPDTDAKVGEFGVTELSNFITGMTDIRTTISTISKTPKHYFFNKGGDPSGEALIAMEAPLNKKCDNYIKSLIEYWRDVVGFMAVIDNLNIDAENITPVFVPPETIQPKTESEIMQAEVGIGLPVVTVLRNHGWTDAEIKQYEKDKAAEQMANAELAAAYMDQARRNSNDDEE